jgi:hypothetical protein
MKYFPSKFHWSAVLAMILTTGVTMVLNDRLVGNGFWNWRGLPFRWYEWHDSGPPFDHYHWWALVADIFIAGAVVLLVGVTAERVGRRLIRAQPHPSRAA